MASEAIAGQCAEGDSTPEDAKARSLPHNCPSNENSSCVFSFCLSAANAPSAQTPVTHQMTAMSISREETSNETEEFSKRDEASSASSPSGRVLGLSFAQNGSKTLASVPGTLLEISQNTAEGKTASEKPKPKKNRCFTCRKKIGLTGFDCRCGNLFCAIHRYSDMHACPYDYKAEAAEKIRKENPIVIAEKIQKL
ncbi:hypothetical protein DV515_00018103 [Chloebia gouldiae]|uniref:AN1-type domain-containing protein n=1 Tax=Chloebia gouldiae TaxID=44316 RepID=A0A3L8Q8H2_CHLGU|nr:hypothetical protein DV515_00018103 [Chloebia gouldiae]